MLPEQVDRLLKNYHQNVERLRELRARAEELRTDIENEMRGAMAAEAIRGQQYAGMPHAGAISRPVEDIAIRYADGYQPPIVREWLEEHARINREISDLSRSVSCVDRWLSPTAHALTDIERQIVMAHYVDGVCWRELAAASRSRIGLHMSESGIRKAARSAMNTLYTIAR